MSIQSAPIRVSAIGTPLSFTLACGGADRGAEADDSTSPEDDGQAESGPDNVTESKEVEIATLARCDAMHQSIEGGGDDASVCVEHDEVYARMSSATYPEHQVMTGSIATHAQVPVPTVGFSTLSPLNPDSVDGWISHINALGIVTHGVPIDDYTVAGEFGATGPCDASKGVIVTEQLDVCRGHVGRGADDHYLKAPNCMVSSMLGSGVGPWLGGVRTRSVTSR